MHLIEEEEKERCFFKGTTWMKSLCSSTLVPCPKDKGTGLGILSICTIKLLMFFPITWIERTISEGPMQAIMELDNKGS